MIGTEGELKIKETGLREVCTVQDVASERFKDWSHEPCNIYIENPVEQIPFDEYHIISIGKLSFHAENLWQKNNYGSLFQTFFEKQSYDVFTNPYVGEFLARTGIKESVVYGVATDYCVKAAVLGMQQRGIQCHVVEDAIKPVTAKGGLAALAEMYAAGAKPSTTKQILRGEYQ
ncbi:isochorismatase family protein [Candidatus Woesearchaeota archaeon]|nr:isochorismatase family protein [Candidatus Woesearchaeota archaeon]